MELSRLIDINLAYYVRNNILVPAMSEFVENASLTQVSSTEFGISVPPSFYPNPFAEGRGIIYYDEVLASGVGYVPDDSHEQLTKVVVKDSGSSIIPPTDYDINYKGGKLINVTNTPNTISYYYNYVSVLDAYEPDSIKLDLPFVAIDSNAQAPINPLELGGGKITNRIINIHVYASNKAERDDIVQFLHKGFENKSTPIVDFNSSNGFILNYNGTFNSNFNKTFLSGSSKIFFTGVSSRNVPGTRDFTYSERYKAIVSLVARVYISFDSV